jgi:choline dehydrogenase-like flavoprotein
MTPNAIKRRNGKDINDETLSTQVCIIGSGPAGGTLAWRLQQAGYEVIVLEGSRDVDTTQKGYYSASWADKEKLYAGSVSGLFTNNEPDFLTLPFDGGRGNAWERERVYGGTGSHWGGQSRPLDPIDFASRPAYWESGPGFPATPQEFTGWPIDRECLNAAYTAAAKLYNLTDDFTTQYWAEQFAKQFGKIDVPKLDGFDTDMYQFIQQPWLNPATRLFDGKPLEQWVDVIVNATVLNIVNDGSRVTEVSCASMNDDVDNPGVATRFTVKADVYVLACGAVANARQLLLDKIGNEHDLVGRYFMCHPLSAYQVIQTDGSYLSSQQYAFMDWNNAQGTNIQGRFIPTDEFATTNKVGRCWFWASKNGGAQYYFEMTPNPDSRITLTDTVDCVFSQPQAKVDWQITDADKHTYETTTAQFQTAVKKLGASIQVQSWETVKAQLIVNGHHIGTTRMAETADKGVVDKNLKVFSMANLYVAGASVFPSTGISNPTFTILALSIRLADHLTERFRG